mgnify:CR=1 FL=1
MAIADCDGTPLWFERRGEGAPLLYCNGSGATLASARPVLDRHAASFDVVGFDHRGMGRSPSSPQPYDMSDLSADVAGLLDHLGWDRCLLAGLSFGGMVAQEFAVTHPERVERLALLSTSPGGRYASYPLETLAELPARERAERSLLLADRRWTPEWLADHPRPTGRELAEAGLVAPHWPRPWGLAADPIHQPIIDAERVTASTR